MTIRAAAKLMCILASMPPWSIIHARPPDHRIWQPPDCETEEPLPLFSEWYDIQYSGAVNFVWAPNILTASRTIRGGTVHEMIQTVAFRLQGGDIKAINIGKDGFDIDLARPIDEMIADGRPVVCRYRGPT